MIGRSLKSSVCVCYNVVLLCLVNLQIRSRDLGSKVKNLIKFTKPHKIQMSIDRNFKPSVSPKCVYTVI